MVTNLDYFMGVFNRNLSVNLYKILLFIFNVFPMFADHPPSSIMFYGILVSKKFNKPLLSISKAKDFWMLNFLYLSASNYGRICVVEYVLHWCYYQF